MLTSIAEHLDKQIMTNGDHYNCPCPYCGKTNHYIAQGYGRELVIGQTILCERECVYCKRAIRYAISVEVIVTAKRQDE